MVTMTCETMDEEEGDKDAVVLHSWGDMNITSDINYSAGSAFNNNFYRDALHRGV